MRDMTVQFTTFSLWILWWGWRDWKLRIRLYSTHPSLRWCFRVGPLDVRRYQRDGYMDYDKPERGLDHWWSRP